MTSPAPTRLTHSGRAAQRAFWLVLGISLVIRLGLSAAIPLTGDEAYFVLWGRHWDWGYYDHPPMIGWIQTLLGLAGNAPAWVVRLPATLLFTAIALISVHLLRRQGVDQTRAHAAGIVVALAPLPFLYSIVTTDTPLIGFAFVSAAFYLEALRQPRSSAFAASGIALGLAFLSKYFAVFLGLSYAVWILAFERDRVRLRGLALLLGTAFPFVLLHLGWNATHSWMTVLFHLQARWGESSGRLHQTGMFLLEQLPLLALPLPVALVAFRRDAREALARSMLARRLLFLFAFPMTLFLLNSWRVSVGFHWVLAFYPFFYLVAGLLLPERALRNTTAALAAFTALHLVVLGYLAARPLESWRGKKLYPGLVLQRRLDTIVAELEPDFARGVPVASTGYTPASLLAQRSGRAIGVFLSDSKYGRAFDLWQNWGALDGKEVVIFTPNLPLRTHAAPYFERIEARELTWDGVTFYLVRGFGFRAAEYRKFLEAMERKFYTPPAWLPSRRPVELLR